MDSATKHFFDFTPLNFVLWLNIEIWKSLSLKAYYKSLSLLFWKVNLPLSPFVFCAIANPSSMSRRNIQTVGGDGTTLEGVGSNKDKRQEESCCVCSRRNLCNIRGQWWGVRQVKNEDVPLEPSAPLLSFLFLYPLYPPKIYKKSRRRDCDLAAPVKPSIDTLR